MGDLLDGGKPAGVGRQLPGAPGLGGRAPPPPPRAVSGDRYVAGNHLFEKVKARVVDGITRGRFRLGDVLPPAEALASRARCSVGTVRRALTELAAEGVVRRVRHKGTVVARPPSVGRVCLLLSQDAHTNLLFQDVVYSRLVEAGYRVDMIPGGVDVPHALERCADLRREPDAADCIVALEPFPVSRDAEGPFWETVRRFERRAVFDLYPPSVPPDVPVVTIDHQLAARSVVEYLLGLGHGKVAVIAGMSPDELSWTREQATHCRHFLEIAGAEFVPHYIADAGIEGILRLFAEGATAYFGVTDDEVVRVGHLCAERGLRVPEDVSLIGRNDTPWAADSRPPLTTVSMNPEGVADAIVEVLGLERRAAKPGRGRIIRKVRPRLVVRGSTGPAPKAGHESGK